MPPSKSSGKRQHDTTGDDAPIAVAEDEVVRILTYGKLEEQGLLPYSSNRSLLVLVTDGDLTLPGVYKPQRGESPLWDFEWGTLCKREAAAYIVSTALGWDLVPPTVLRGGPRGLGSVQFYVANDTDAHYFTVQPDARFAGFLRRLALFDYAINNADRKSGHCLVGTEQRLWAIDHGLCFHVDYKLRTVIWEYSDQPIEPALCDDLQALRRRLCDPQDPALCELDRLLSAAERAALIDRLDRLVQSEHYPAPSPYRRNYPWPPV